MAILLAAPLLTGCLAGKFMCNYALKPTPHGVDDIERTRHKADSLCPGVIAWYDNLHNAGVFKDTTIVGEGGFKIHAVYAPAKNPAKAEGNFEGYHEQRRRLLGDAADQPKRIRFRPI